MNVARNGDIEIAYDVEGTGPDLLLVAGTASTRALWALVRPSLARSFRTIAFDNRDAGASTQARSAYRLADLAADAVAVLDAVGSQTAHVLGHSMGGAIAQELALTYPARLASLTLVCTWARGNTYTKNLMELMADLTQTVTDDRALLAAILFIGSGITTLSSTSLSEMTDGAMALGALNPRASLLRQWRLNLTVDTLDRLSELDLPVHVIWGDEDRLLPPPLSQQLLHAIAGAAETRIDRCGHVPMVAAPEAFVDAVTTFLTAPRSGYRSL